MITLSPSQQEACTKFRAFLRDPKAKEFLLCGFAGTGKSFLTTYLIDLVEREHQLIKLISPDTAPITFIPTATTHKAARVLAEMLGTTKTSTTHSTLALVVVNNWHEGTTYLTRSKSKSPDLQNDSLLIIDESSMLDFDLVRWVRKITSEYKNCKVLYIGDKCQLPPVLENTSRIFNTVEHTAFLTDIQRQAANSPIIGFSSKYREVLEDPTKQWPTIPSNQAIVHYTDPQEWVETIRDTYLTAQDTTDLRILAWSNDKVRKYNKYLRKQFGHNDLFTIGETLICNNAITKNNRILASTDSIWEVEGVSPDTRMHCTGHNIKLRLKERESLWGTRSITVFHPTDWGRAIKIKNAIAKDAKKLRHSGDTKESAKLWNKYWTIANTWGDFRPLYAQTVHKAQGSTYEEVFIDVADIGKNNKWYEVARLMYTAVTRASTRIHLFGDLPQRENKANPDGALEEFKDAKGTTTYTR